jgi:hypothetical protein
LSDNACLYKSGYPEQQTQSSFAAAAFSISPGKLFTAAEINCNVLQKENFYFSAAAVHPRPFAAAAAAARKGTKENYCRLVYARARAKVRPAAAVAREKIKNSFPTREREL